MHSSHGSSRRHSRYDEDELIVTRLDDRSESFNRPLHHHTSRAESYVGSQRSYTDSSSRPHPQLDWENPDSSYSASHDVYREETSMPSRRDYYNNTDSWSGRHSNHSNHHHSSSSTREWTKREDRGYNYSSEGNTWRNSRYDSNRSRNGADDWGRDNIRVEREKKYERDVELLPEETHHRARDDAHFIETDRDRRPLVWPDRSDQRQWRTSGHNYDPERQREREVDWNHDQKRFSQASDDRQWEPAASWKSRENDDTTSFRHDRSQLASFPPKVNKKFNKNKKGPVIIKREGIGRRDDTMNNWKKRDYRTAHREKEPVSASRRRLACSPESRSRSPSISAYSRRSSARSRSRSPTPKHRKRNEESPRRETTAKNDNRRNRPSPAPQYETVKRGRQRRGSVSSRSSRSRSRSRSSSEGMELKPKPKHRLPTTTSLHDIEIQAKSMRLLVNQQSRQTNGDRSPKRDRSSERKQGKKHAQDADDADYQDERDVMPPPMAPVSSSKASTVSQGPGTVTLDTHKGAKRNAGFKPIGLAPSSASIKRFFPGEDEETDSDNVQSMQNQKSSGQPSQNVEERSRKANSIEVSKHTEESVETRDSRPKRNGSSTHLNGNTSGHAPLRDRDTTTKTRSEVMSTNGKRPVNEMYGSSSREGSLPSGSGLPTDIPYHPSSTVPSPLQHGEGVTVKHQPTDTPKDQIYSILSQVGEGTFGKVYKAQNNISGVHVALKRIRMETERDGFPVTAMREIKLLQSLRHVNVIELMEMMVHNGSVYMVFEYMDHDLTGVLSQTQFTFSDAHLKSLCQQMLQGLSYLHRKSVIHRDIKGSNILLNNRGELKLADFGLARFYQKRRRADYTNRVITLWYRPPELLLGTTVYGPEVDMWSAGCIMLELYCKKPVFQGNDEIHQLDVIYKILGTPTPSEWPGLSDMPWYELVKPRDVLRNRFRDLFQRWLSPAGLDLAEQLLTYDPARRATADQALGAPYFTQEQPTPSLPSGLSTIEGEWHEFESKRERAKKRRRLENAPSGSTGQSAQ